MDAIHLEAAVFADVKKCRKSFIVESVSSCGSRVDPEGAVDSSDHGDMTVADDEHVELVALDELSGGPVRAPRIARNVTDSDASAAEFKNRLLRQKTKVAAIDVSLDRRHLGDLLEAFDDRLLADVTRVYDGVDAVIIEDVDQALVEPTVGIGEEADGDGRFTHTHCPFTVESSVLG